MSSKVSSDRLPIYIKATRPVLEIFKYLTDSPRTLYQVRFHPVLLLRATLLLPVFLLVCPVAYNFHAGT